MLELVGPPTFPTGCLVEGDLDGLVRGERVTLRLEPALRLRAAV